MAGYVLRYGTAHRYVKILPTVSVSKGGEKVEVWNGTDPRYQPHGLGPPVVPFSAVCRYRQILSLGLPDCSFSASLLKTTLKMLETWNRHIIALGMLLDVGASRPPVRSGQDWPLCFRCICNVHRWSANEVSQFMINLPSFSLRRNRATPSIVASPTCFK